MKVQKILLAVTVMLIAFCKDEVDPAVQTIRVYGDYKAEREKAFPNLYNYYAASSKSMEYYEVVFKGDFILNYYPQGRLLTVCSDPGSGWSGQFKEFDESDLKKLSDDGITIDEIAGFGHIGNNLDSLYSDILVKSDPFFEIKTNGNPR
jgi:hypothetical protein